MVSARQQQQVRSQLAENKKRSPRRTKYDYLLRTLVVCGECGLRMACGSHTSVDKRYHYDYYVCARRDPADTGRTTRCSAPLVRADRLDAVVWEAVRAWLEDPAMLHHEVEAWRTSRAAQPPRAKERRRLEALGQELGRQLDRLLDAYQAGAMSVQELRARRERLAARQEQQQELLRQLAVEELDTQRLTRISEDLSAFAAQLRAGLTTLDFAGRQRTLRLLLERVVVTGEEVAIEHVIPLSGRFCGLRLGEGTDVRVVELGPAVEQE